MKNETEPVISDAADDLINRAENYSMDSPLYVIAIGAITNIASALLLKPEIKEKIVVVWLGGNKHDFDHTAEFNMMQDIASARIVFGCGVPLVQLPCSGVVDDFKTTGPELDFWLKGKNKLCDYLLSNTIDEAETYARVKYGAVSFGM